LTIIEENTGNTTVQRNERKRGGMEVSEKLRLVAGEGFEPSTFGL
jgi:hypothetical protein